MVFVAALILWFVAVILCGCWLARLAEEPAPVPPAPRDPILDIVDKWAHDWERGRA